MNAPTPERVAQSANANVRAPLQVFLSELRMSVDALQENEYEPETVISALFYLGELQSGHVEDDVLAEAVRILRAFLDGADSGEAGS